VAYQRLEGWEDYLVNTPSKGTELIPVLAVGMGCMLTEISIYDKMKKPYFQTTWVPDLNDHIGEDFTFCKNAKELGYDILIDNDTSLNVSHLGTFAFTQSMVKTSAE
jgi:hypothetical protein